MRVSRPAEVEAVVGVAMSDDARSAILKLNVHGRDGELALPLNLARDLLGALSGALSPLDETRRLGPPRLAVGVKRWEVRLNPRPRAPRRDVRLPRGGEMIFRLDPAAAAPLEGAFRTLGAKARTVPDNATRQ